MKKRSQTPDDQKLQKKPGLEAVPCDAESCCDKAALSDDDLEKISAAGDITVPTVNPEVLLGRHDIPRNTEESKP